MTKEECENIKNIAREKKELWEHLDYSKKEFPIFTKIKIDTSKVRSANIQLPMVNCNWSKEIAVPIKVWEQAKPVIEAFWHEYIQKLETELNEFKLEDLAQ